MLEKSMIKTKDWYIMVYSDEDYEFRDIMRVKLGNLEH